MDNNYVTLREVVEMTNIPENSCKRYLTEHEDFLDFKKVHNRFMIHVGSIDTLKNIRKLYGEGLKRDGVQEKLAESGLPITITMNDESEESFINLNEEIANMQKNLSVGQRNIEEKVDHVEDSLEKMMRVIEAMHRNSEMTHNLMLEMKKDASTELAALPALTNQLEEQEKSLMKQKESDWEKQLKQQEAFLDSVKQTVRQTFKEAVEEEKKEQPESKGFFQRLFGR